MKVRFSNYIYLYPENENEKKTIKYILEEALIYPNPKYEAAIASGFFPKGIPKFLKTYDFVGGKYFIIPKGCLEIYEHIKTKFKPTEEVIDRVEGKEINFKCRFKLRDEEQIKAANAFLNHKAGNGILSLPCGLTCAVWPTINQVNLEI